MYIAGTRNKQDWYDDFTKLPFWGSTTKADRYKSAEQVLKDNPQIKSLVGHSLSSSVSAELQKQYPDRQLNLKALYGSPFVDFGFQKKTENRYRHLGDFVSVLDRNNQVIGGSFNPIAAHGYDKY